MNREMGIEKKKGNFSLKAKRKQRKSLLVRNNEDNRTASSREMSNSEGSKRGVEIADAVSRGRPRGLVVLSVD